MNSREFKYHRRQKFKVYKRPRTIIFKKPKCPICGEKIIVDTNEWELDKWGWMATDCSVDCSSFPGFNDEFDDWMDSHYQTPYVDWLPIQQKILSFLKKKVRFLSTSSSVIDGYSL